MAFHARASGRGCALLGVLGVTSGAAASVLEARVPQRLEHRRVALGALRVGQLLRTVGGVAVDAALVGVFGTKERLHLVASGAARVAGGVGPVTVEAAVVAVLEQRLSSGGVTLRALAAGGPGRGVPRVALEALLGPVESAVMVRPGFFVALPTVPRSERILAVGLVAGVAALDVDLRLRGLPPQLGDLQGVLTEALSLAPRPVTLDASPGVGLLREKVVAALTLLRVSIGHLSVHAGGGILVAAQTTVAHRGLGSARALDPVTVRALGGVLGVEVGLVERVGKGPLLSRRRGCGGLRRGLRPDREERRRQGVRA